MKLCIVQPALGLPSETFLRVHADLLPFETTVIHFENGLPCTNHRPIFSQDFIPKIKRKIIRTVLHKGRNWKITGVLEKAFRDHADVVLAEYGPTAVKCCEAARLAGVPLVAHFHGFDASKYDVLEKHKDSYRYLFSQSAAIVAVSNRMVNDLISIGAPRDKVHLNPCGVDVEVFDGIEPGGNGPILVAVGRFVEKKAPYLTIMAFARALEEVPNAKLVMLGGGALEGVCRDIAAVMGISSSVEFLGKCSHDQVREALLNARAFVQHSVQASDGDCEGTPVSVMEAQAMGLPVIATRHAGIADVVVHGETGYLVEEKDVLGMASYMSQVLTEPLLASRFGASGRQRVIKNYSTKISIDRLGMILNECLS